MARALDVYSEQASKLTERVGELVGALAKALGGLLGGDGAPKPAYEGLAQGLAFYSERVGELVSALAQALGGLLGGDGAPKPVGSPIVPPGALEPLSPVPPSGPSPESNLFSGVSVSSGGASVLLFAAMVLLSLFLMRSGKPLWLRCEVLKPKSDLRLAIERPG